MRCSEASEGELCPNSTCERKLAENPVRCAKARTDIFRDFRVARSRGPSSNLLAPCKADAATVQYYLT